MLLASPTQTNSILYTWDQGLTFNTFQLTSSYILIKGVEVEPVQVATMFLLYALDVAT